MQGTGQGGEQRAAPPQLPQLTAEQKQQLEAAAIYHKEREQEERRSVMRGLILIALLILAVSILRGGVGRVFFHGWWRP